MVEQTIIDIDDDLMFDDDVSQWSAKKVIVWLRQNGYKDLEYNLTSAHPPITGDILLTLDIEDLQQTPFNIVDLRDREHLQLSIENLKKHQFAKYMKKLHLNGTKNGYHNGISKPVLEHSLVSNGAPYTINESENRSHDEHLTPPLLSSDEQSDYENTRGGIDLYPVEKLKTSVGLLYLGFGFVLNVMILQFVHERVPSMTEDPPLPDLFFDITPKRVEWAFSVCETNGIILVIGMLILGIFHRHRFIICRRIFFIMGTLYIYRSCTMLVTTLPVPGLHFRCAAKTQYKLSIMMSRAAALLFGGGLTVTGSHHLCGDYLFSGHTIILVISYLTITEYTSKRWWWLHWISWLLSAVGIVCILLAHDHYTVDVVVAYLLTTRLFWTYHTMCNTSALKEKTNANLLSRAWWFPIFQYLEGNVSANGTLPCQFEWPLPWPRSWRKVANIRPLSGNIKGV